MFSAFGMMHCNKLSTFGENLLDLCFANKLACITNTCTVPPLVNFDHDNF